jgi:hypothetical protein
VDSGLLVEMGGEQINWDWSSVVLLLVVKRENGGVKGFPLTFNSCYKP